MHAEYFHQLQFIVEVSFDHEKEKEKRFDPALGIKNLIIKLAY